MGIQDRDYYREDPRTAGYTGGMTGGIGRMRMWSVTTWLIAINIAVFLLDALLLRAGIGYVHGLVALEGGGLGQAIVPYDEFRALEAEGLMRGLDTLGFIERWCYFSFTTAVGGFQVWRWITFQFMHASLGHIFGNMLGLYFFGTMIEQYLGHRRFLAFYLLCGIAGPVVYLFFALTGILGTSLSTPMVGASAGVFGILLAAAQVAPRTTVMLMFPPIPMQLRTLALILLAIAAYTVFTQGRNAGGEAAHLGGAALGFFLIRRPELLNWAQRLPKLPGRKGPSNMTYHGWR